MSSCREFDSSGTGSFSRPLNPIRMGASSLVLSRFCARRPHFLAAVVIGAAGNSLPYSAGPPTWMEICIVSGLILAEPGETWRGFIAWRASGRVNLVCFCRQHEGAELAQICIQPASSEHESDTLTVVFQLH